MEPQQELWPARFNRNAIAILNTALVYYQKPTFPQLHRHDYADNAEYLVQFDVSVKKKPREKELPAEDIEEAARYATSQIRHA